MTKHKITFRTGPGGITSIDADRGKGVAVDLMRNYRNSGRSMPGDLQTSIIAPRTIPSRRRIARRGYDIATPQERLI